MFHFIHEEGLWHAIISVFQSSGTVKFDYFERRNDCGLNVMKFQCFSNLKL